MASPPQLPGVVLLVLGLCCAAVICQGLNSEDIGQEKTFLYKSLHLKHVKLVVDICNTMPNKCPVQRKKCYLPLTERTLFYFADIYLNHTKGEGNPDTMNAKEYAEYLKNDIPEYLEDLGQKALTSLDEDGDGELSVLEYFSFLRNVIKHKLSDMENNVQ
ncbi:uncharacterized protein ACNLHF_004359 [Anomaloglossus baeobatrachus]|uniref:uncharacterized protein LOC142257769 n=1 Tax=Anomaloglossus baeobatrachus TaxID=238106 RepID=UPI003F503351